MLGDINPQTVRITQQAVVYPSRDHVTSLRVERFDGRSYKPVDMTAVTRVILSFPEASPVIVYDSALQAVFTHVGAELTVDLSDYAMPASVLGCQIILFDAQHPAGQVLVDDIDTTVQFDFRNISTTGGTPPPAVEYLADAPSDGVTYARRNGLWVPVDALVSGVSSVNSKTGTVVLTAADVGADAAGTAAAAVAAHVGAPDPHPQYLTPAEGDLAYTPASHVGGGGAAHAAVVSDGAAGFMTGTDKAKLDGIAAGAQVNVPTDLSLGTITGTTIPLNSSTGTDVTLPAATVSAAGLQTATDKTKLDGVAAGATANATNAELRDRQTHTGTQLSTTISDFTEATQDVIGAAITAGTNVTVSYNDATGQTTINALGGGGASLPVVQTFTGAKTLALTDINTYNVSQDATAQAVTLPAQATVGWTADAEIHIERGAAGAVSITGAAGVQINGSVAGIFTLGAQYSVVTLKRKGSNLWTLFGNAS